MTFAAVEHSFPDLPRVRRVCPGHIVEIDEHKVSKRVQFPVSLSHVY